ncbi:uncharacterized protein ACRADG_010797 [Cochliomyia hominivorax]
MKTIIVSQLILLVVLLSSCYCPAETNASAEAVKKAAEECIKEGGLSADETKRIKANELFSPKYKEISEKLQCFLLCCYKKIGVIDATGKQKGDVLMAYLEHRFSDKKAKIKPALAKCVNIKTSNPCEAVYAFEGCVLKNMT